MIRVSFRGSDTRVLNAIRSRAPRMLEVIAAELDTLMLELQKRVQAKLSGEVLEHRSGKLLGSVVKEPTVQSENAITGRVTAAGGPAFYGQVQERGGTRQYDILPKNKLALAFFPGGSVGGSISKGVGQFLPGKSTVRGLYVRSGGNRGELRPQRLGTFSQLGGIVVKKVVHPPLPARPFMSTSLQEMQSEIINRIRSAAARGLKA